MKAIKVHELKNYLMSRTQEEMVSEVTELFQMIKELKQYYTIKLDSQGAEQRCLKHIKISLRMNSFQIEDLKKRVYQ
jgi:hypothetical protein